MGFDGYTVYVKKNGKEKMKSKAKEMCVCVGGGGCGGLFI